MCLARPVKVTKVEGDWVEVADHGGAHRAWSGLLYGKDLNAGDYLLVHGELAIHKLPEDEALKILELVETLPGH